MKMSLQEQSNCALMTADEDTTAVGDFKVVTLDPIHSRQTTVCSTHRISNSINWIQFKVGCVCSAKIEVTVRSPSVV